MSLHPLRPLEEAMVKGVRAGPPPKLEWLPLAALGIDPDYQRPITKQGRKNILKIAAAFRWQCFSPLIVAPVAGGRYAIIDGQHRATAALSRGYEKVPCMIVKADVEEAASIFAAVNGSVTGVSSLQLFKAARAAKEEWALAVDRACAAAGVTPLVYPISARNQKPGMTMSVAQLRFIYARHGEATLTLLLRAMMATAGAAAPGFLSVKELVRCRNAILTVPGHADRAEDILAVFSGLNLAHTSPDDLVRLLARRCRGGGRQWAETVAEASKLRGRRYTIQAIAARLRVPYSEIARALEEAAWCAARPAK